MSVASPVIDYLDLATKHIYLLPGVREYHPVEDIYVEIRNRRRVDETMRVFDQPVSAEGAAPKGGGKYTPRYAIFRHGWTVVPENVPHSLFISGEQITDDGQSGPACIDTASLTVSVIIQYEPPAAEIIRDEDSLRAINRMAFNDRIAYNTTDGYAGTGIAPNGFQIGTSGAPSNNISDSYEIASVGGFRVGAISGVLNLTAAELIDGNGDPIVLESFIFIGESRDRTTINIDAIPDVINCSYYESKVTGTLDGKSKLIGCLVEDLYYIQGSVELCVLSAVGRVQLGGGGQSEFLSCYSGFAGEGAPIVDMGGSGQSLSMRDYNGGVLITNKTGQESITIDLGSGQVLLDIDGNFGVAGVTAGTIVVRGDGKVIDATTGDYLPSGTYGSVTLRNETVGIDSFSASKYNNRVYIDAESLTTGISDPYGLIHTPVNDIYDGDTILHTYNLVNYHFHSDYVVPEDFDFSGHTVSSHNSLITLSLGVTAADTDFYRVNITGQVSGDGQLYNMCSLFDISGVSGDLVDCKLGASVSLAGDTLIRNAMVPFTNPVTIHTNGYNVNIPEIRGNATLASCTGGAVNISLRGGMLTVDPSCIAGSIYIDNLGSGAVTDNSNGASVTIKEFTSTSVADSVLNTVSS